LAVVMSGGSGAEASVGAAPGMGADTGAAVGSGKDSVGSGGALPPGNSGPR